MEPQLPQVNVQPENQPVPNVMPEQSVNAGEKTPEAPVQSPEAVTGAEKSNTDNLGQVAPLITSDVPADAGAPQQDQAVNDDANPTVASDGDVIEKEWITKAKSIVSKTSDNPHQQQHQVSKLMIDYVLKRYGRKIGESNG